MPAPDFNEHLIRIDTALFGRSGNNGLNGDVKRHSTQIGELFARGEAVRAEISERDEHLRREIDVKLDRLNDRIFYLTIAVVGGAIGIIGALAGTQFP